MWSSDLFIDRSRRPRRLPARSTGRRVGDARTRLDRGTGTRPPEPLGWERALHFMTPPCAQRARSGASATSVPDSSSSRLSADAACRARGPAPRPPPVPIHAYRQHPITSSSCTPRWPRRRPARTAPPAPPARAGLPPACCAPAPGPVRLHRGRVRRAAPRRRSAQRHQANRSAVLKPATAVTVPPGITRPAPPRRSPPPPRRSTTRIRQGETAPDSGRSLIAASLPPTGGRRGCRSPGSRGHPVHRARP